MIGSVFWKERKSTLLCGISNHAMDGDVIDGCAWLVHHAAIDTTVVVAMVEVL